MNNPKVNETSNNPNNEALAFIFKGEYFSKSSSIRKKANQVNDEKIMVARIRNNKENGRIYNGTLPRSRIV